MSLVASSHGSMEPGCIRAVFPGAGLIRTSSFNVARSNEITRYVKAAKLAQPRKMCSYNTSNRGQSPMYIFDENLNDTREKSQKKKRQLEAKQKIRSRIL